MVGLNRPAFVWAVRSGQFDELETPPLDILREDSPPSEAASEDAGDSR
jgi:cbb3-type cytochrome oxidase maturation protein